VPIERAEADAELAEPASRFVQERKLTSGGHGDIFLGRDTLTGEPVAIKRLKPEIVTQDPDIVARFLQEAEVLRRLDHPNIVKLLAVAETEAGTMIVMEYIPGGSLRDLLDKEPRLPLRHALDIALELADALARTHHLGIILRDLKPATALLAAYGSPRLSDFGIARMTQGETRLTQTGSFLGTVAYLSPEACQGGELNERHDIWSFGMMLYEVLAGQLPFAADNPVAMIQAVLTESVPDLMQSRPDVPLKLVALIERMLSKDSAMRPSRMRQIAAELEAIRDDVGL
jgi:serine/threonine-protein kinase